MDIWWQSLSMIEKIYWISALSGTGIFSIQMILTFTGLHDGGHDLMLEEIGNTGINKLNNKDEKISFFTLRNMVAFSAVFGWAGIASIDEFNMPMSLMISIFAGTGAMLSVNYLLKNILRLAIDKTMKNKDALHQIGEVYIPIPEKETGIGKVNIMIQSTVHELQAKAAGKSLSVGSKVIVLDILEDGVLLVDEWLEEKI